MTAAYEGVINDREGWIPRGAHGSMPHRALEALLMSRPLRAHIVHDLVKRLAPRGAAREEVKRHSRRSWRTIVPILRRCWRSFAPSRLMRRSCRGSNLCRPRECDGGVIWLASHFAQFRTIRRRSSVGRRLDFLLQINREMNTIDVVNKCSHSAGGGRRDEERGGEVARQVQNLE